MDESEVHIPVRCPKCSATVLTPFPIVVVVVALTTWNQMRLYATCHEVAWDASPSDLQLIREHLSDAWIESQRQLIEDEKFPLEARAQGKMC